MVQYGTESLIKLRNVICNRCTKKVPSWDNEVYKCWLRYLKGADRQELIKDTRFSLYVSPRYYFRKHPCYKKISSIRKLAFRSVKIKIKGSLLNHPWLLGIYYADGYMRTRKTQLAFALGKNEGLIANHIESELRCIVSDKAHIARDWIGNMLQIRIHSTELCRLFPEKKNKQHFRKLWSKFNISSKIKFMAGFIDGDGSCQYDVGINSIQIYSKAVPFILEAFKNVLSRFGYVSQKGYKLYLSPPIGKLLKPYIEKRNISNAYAGKVNVKTAFKLLVNGMPMREISRKLHKDRKTITLALRKTYGWREIQHYLDAHNTKLNSKG